MATTITSDIISRPQLSETKFGGTVCGKSARTGLWGCGEVTNRTTRNSESYRNPNKTFCVVTNPTKKRTPRRKVPKLRIFIIFASSFKINGKNICKKHIKRILGSTS
jgi:hypothetical protein